MELKCCKSYCRDAAVVSYLGHLLCQSHWVELANAPVDEEPKLLSALNLRRTEGVATRGDDGVFTGQGTVGPASHAAGD